MKAVLEQWKGWATLYSHCLLLCKRVYSGVARVPGQMVGVATCYKVNFDTSFEYLAGSYLLLKLTIDMSYIYELRHRH